MNVIPHWVFAAIAVVGICLVFYGKYKKKLKLVFPGTMGSLIGSVLFILANAGAFNPDPFMVEGNLWRAEAYGVSEAVKQLYPNQQIAILGWLPAEHRMVLDYMQTLERLGVQAKYVAVAGFPPIGVPVSKQLELIGNAIDKCGDMNIFVYRNAVLPDGYMDSDAYSDDYRFIQTSYDTRELLWDEGVVTAEVKPRFGVEAESLSMTSVQAAFEKGYELKINSNKK